MLNCVLNLLLFRLLFQFLSCVDTRVSLVVFLLPPLSDYFRLNCLFFIPGLIVILLIVVSTDGSWDLCISDGQGCGAYAERLIFSLRSNHLFFINYLLYWIVFVRGFCFDFYCRHSNWSFFLF